jgi:RNA polymerase sigma factor (sigma-70 family)
MTPLLAQRPRADRGFERLYRRHVRDVYHYALAVLRNPADAEDVTQTTFLNALRAYDRGERPQAPQNWLIAIAHNVCRQRFRQSLRRPHEVSFDDDLAARIVDDDVPSADDIRQALAQLAFNQRAALVMRELEGRTYADIAAILGLSVGAVETLLFRARRALREQLEGSLTCRETELALSRQLDRRLPRAERGPLRAHLRACKECATMARRQRAQRAAFRSLAAVPLPSSLASLFGGGGAAVGTGIAAKAAAVLATGALVGGLGYEGARHSGIVRRDAKQPVAPRAARPAPPKLAVASLPQLRQSRLVRQRAAHARKHAAALSRAKHAAAKASVRAKSKARASRPAPRGRPALPPQAVRPVHPVHPNRPARPVRPPRAARPAHPIHPAHPARPPQARSTAAPAPKKTPPGQAAKASQSPPSPPPPSAGRNSPKG